MLSGSLIFYMKETIKFWLAVSAVFMIPFVPVGIWVMKSSLEARAYNRVTGSNVTTWEAMWVELRVQNDAN
jgi:hypothetical protein